MKNFDSDEPVDPIVVLAYLNGIVLHPSGYWVPTAQLQVIIEAMETLLNNVEQYEHMANDCERELNRVKAMMPGINYDV